MSPSIRKRVTASPLFVPAKSDRATSRAARAHLATARDQARDANRPEARAAASGLGPELRATYPAAGRPGAASARGGRLKLPAHRMTTATASGAYPFLAEGGLGAQGIYIGRDVHAEAAFCYDPFSLYGRLDGFTNPNILLAGVIGMGKSAVAKSLAVRAVAFGYRIYVPCDPKGVWTVVARELGGQTIALGPGLPGRLNPLDAPARPSGVSEEDWRGEVRKRRLLLLGSLAKTVLRRELHPMEHTALDVALDEVVAHAEAAWEHAAAGADRARPRLAGTARHRTGRALRPPRGRRRGPRPRPATHGARRPGRDVRRRVDRRLRPERPDAVHRPLPSGRRGRRHRTRVGDDLRVRVDGIRTRRSRCRAAVGDL